MNGMHIATALILLALAPLSHAAEPTLTSWLPDGLPAQPGRPLTVRHDFVPSGSTWADGLDERQVFHAQLASPGAEWQIGLGQGGQIYSLRGPYGEALPPQRPPLSEWNDEVWQLVVVAQRWQRQAKVTGWPWFLHGSGTYRRQPQTQRSIYGPIVATQQDAASNAYTVMTWPQQPNLPSPFASSVFFTTRLRALDALTVEMTYGIHNAGAESIDYISLPWGGVRASAFPLRAIVQADGTFASFATTFAEATEWTVLTDTGGWLLFAGDTPDSPALALVMGRVKEPWPGAVYRVRGGYAGLPDKTNRRDYFVVSGNLKGALAPHESLACRQFLVSGRRQAVEARARELATQGLLVKHRWADETVRPLAEGLFPVPVPGSRPRFVVQPDPASPAVETEDPYLYATRSPATNPLPPDHPLHAEAQDLRLIHDLGPATTTWRLLGFARTGSPKGR